MYVMHSTVHNRQAKWSNSVDVYQWHKCNIRCDSESKMHYDILYILSDHPYTKEILSNKISETIKDRCAIEIIVHDLKEVFELTAVIEGHSVRTGYGFYFEDVQGVMGFCASKGEEYE